MKAKKPCEWVRNNTAVQSISSHAIRPFPFPQPCTLNAGHKLQRPHQAIIGFCPSRVSHYHLWNAFTFSISS